MSVLKKLAGQAATYGVSSILGRVINFLLVPFYTAIISRAEFGIYSELYAYMAFLNVVYLFGLETTFFRFATKNPGQKEKVYNSVESALFTTSFLFSALIIALSSPISDLLDYPDRTIYIVFLGCILFVDAIVAIPFARLRLESNAKKFASLKLINIVLNVSFNLFFLVLCRQIYKGEFLTQLQPIVNYIYIPDFEVGYIILSNLLANTLQIPMLRREFSKLKFHLDISFLKPLYKYAYPLMFMGLAGMVNEVLDRILLRVMLPNGYGELSTLEVIGVYGACYKLSMFMALTIQAFRYAAEPFFFSQAKEKNAPGLFSTVMKYFIIGCSFIYVLVSCNLPLFGHILRDPSYRVGLIIVPILLLANMFLGIYINLSVWYKLTDKTYAGTVITFVGAGITIVANIFLIPVLGYVGAAVATLICYSGMALICYLWGQKHFAIPYNVFSAVAYLSFSTAIVWACIEYLDLEGILRHVVGIGISLAYMILAVGVEFKNLKKDLREL